MCGRYTVTVTLEELMIRYGIDEPTDRYHTPRYNVAPMQGVPIVVHDGRANRMGQLRWGLVPSWAEDDKIGGKMINARAETLREKKSFAPLLARKRCLVPADGFYEWRKDGDGKQPMRITMQDGSVFSMAGLYDTWQRPDGTKLGTFTVITTEPNELMAPIHDRMPVILNRRDEAEWLRRDNDDLLRLLELLRPFPAAEMKAYPVGAKVGNVRNDAPDLLDNIAR